MTILTASVQSLALSRDEFLQSLERSVRRWLDVREEEEKRLLSLKILKQSRRLVLLETFLITSEVGLLPAKGSLCAKDFSSAEGSSPIKSPSPVTASPLMPIEATAEKLQQVCRVLVSQKMNEELEGMQQPSAKMKKLLVHFYRLLYQMLDNSFVPVTILH